MNNPDALAKPSKFGLLTTHTDNIGDEIQALAVRRLLPRVDHYVDRDNVDLPVDGVPGSTRIVLNGWWNHSPEHWPPSSDLLPLLISFHLSPFRSPALGLIPKDVFTAKPAVDYFKNFGPVGARDLGTLEVLQRAGVEAYFSGCMTLTLQCPPVQREDDLIVLNDVPSSVATLIRSRTTKRIITTRHAGFGAKPLKDRFEEANQLLNTYGRASCVVTTRLHCALPSVAIGTPVLLIDTADDPKRFAGLHEFVHHMSVEKFVSSSPGYDVNRPPSNLGNHVKCREQLISAVQEFCQSSTLRPPFSFSDWEKQQITRVIYSQIATQVTGMREHAKGLREELNKALN